MASVLLVDDEKNIRNGLRAIISRSGSNFSSIDECSNGTNALQMLAQKHYDLLITDLLMPQMDGIELLTRMEGMEDKPYTVILSAYDDFKYAQKAIGLGVKAYLLKPVDRNELQGILKKAEIELAERKTAIEESAGNPLVEFYENQLSLILLNENLSTEESEKILGICDLDISRKDYYITAVDFCGVYHSEEKSSGNLSFNKHIKMRLAERHAKGYSFLDQKGNIVMLLDRSEELRELLDPIEKAYGCTYSAGVGCVCRNPAEMRLSYVQAEYALRSRILNQSKRIISYNEIAISDEKPIIPVRLIKNLAGMLDTERKEDLAKLVHQIFDESTMNRNRLGYLEKLAQSFRDEVIQSLSENIPNKIDFIQEQENSFKSIYEFGDIHEYIQFVLGLVMNINDVLLKMKSTYNTDDEIDLALKYVRENYSKDLSMAEVANHICLNYSYFSLLFKGRTGMNFVDYLKKIRIEKAMALLKNSDYKIYEISEMVGYNNTKHFTTTFREFTGISPKEYRERIYMN